MVVLYEVIQRPTVRAALISSTDVSQCHTGKGREKEHWG